MAGKRPVVVVIGAGFAGLRVVQRLRKCPVDVLLIDKHNHHLFQPLLYQVATAALSPADIAYPIRRIFRRQKNVAVVLGEVEGIDLAKQEVTGYGKHVHFDYLVVAVGATHSYFDHPEWERHAPGLKTIDDATVLRRRMLLAFEEAEYETDEEARRAKLTFVVVGGGPTGVEMAGALREIAANDIQRDFRNIDTTTTRIILVQSGDRLLGGMSLASSERAKADLEAMGVVVRLNGRVTHIDEQGVWIGEEQLKANNVIWAAGVQAWPLLKAMGVETDRAGRVVVGPDLSVPGHRNVFVVGDAAAATDARTGKPIPGLAPAAMQMGEFVANLIRSEVCRTPAPDQRPAFVYRDKGTMATIGTHRAVADTRWGSFGGFFAWLAWGLIHIMFLVSFRSRLWVMFNWLEEYLTGSREVRLITGDVPLKAKKLPTPDVETP